MTTCSGGSEHYPHRSFAQPSWSKKSDRNQKYVDDNSPETINSISLNELGGLLLDMDFVPNKAYKIMGSAHLKGGSLGNPRPPLSINKEPTSFEKKYDWLDPLSGYVDNPSPSRHSTVLSSLDRSVVTRSMSRHSTDESSLDRRVVTRPFCRYSTILSSHGAERSLASICAVAWLDLSRSLDSISRGHSTRSLAVTRLVLRGHSTRIALSQSLRLLVSLEHDVILRRHVHP
ncbi:hypothetical protein YC2023_075120 [Brassica napus]